jgi:hypothetical protein
VTPPWLPAIEFPSVDIAPPVELLAVLAGIYILLITTLTIVAVFDHDADRRDSAFKVLDLLFGPV